MNIFSKALKSFGPRIIGSVAALGAGWLFAKTKGAVQVNPDQVVEIATTMLGSYAVTHRIVSAVGLNPGDAASGTLATAEKTALATGTPVTPPAPDDASRSSGSVNSFAPRGE